MSRRSGASACSSKTRMRSMVRAETCGSGIRHFLHVAREPDADPERKHERESEQPEQLEVDPKIGGYVESNHQVHDTDHHEEHDPELQQLFPDARRDDDLRAQDALQEIALPEEPATKKDHAEQPIEDG